MLPDQKASRAIDAHNRSKQVVGTENGGEYSHPTPSLAPVGGVGTHWLFRTASTVFDQGTPNRLHSIRGSRRVHTGFAYWLPGASSTRTCASNSRCILHASQGDSTLTAPNKTSTQE